MKPPNTNSTKTVLTIVVGFLVIFLITKGEWALYVSVLVGIAGLASSFLANKIHFLWMKLSWLLSLIVPNIILSIIFFLFLFPIALLSRVTKKEDQLRLKNIYQTTFKEVNKTFDKKSFENPW